MVFTIYLQNILDTIDSESSFYHLWPAFNVTIWECMDIFLNNNTGPAAIYDKCNHFFSCFFCDLRNQFKYSSIGYKVTISN